MDLRHAKLFLDEVAELSTHMQAKLLRVLESGEYSPLGGKTKYADIRIISATNRDIHQMLTDGIVREDFYHRLNVISLEMPPLRPHFDIKMVRTCFKFKVTIFQVR